MTNGSPKTPTCQTGVPAAAAAAMVQPAATACRAVRCLNDQAGAWLCAWRMCTSATQVRLCSGFSISGLGARVQG